jgi:hypothetical protein
MNYYFTSFSFTITNFREYSRHKQVGTFSHRPNYLEQVQYLREGRWQNVQQYGTNLRLSPPYPHFKYFLTANSGLYEAHGIWWSLVIWSVWSS